MEQPTQQIDAFTLVVIEQRNDALNQLAFWRAKATEALAQIAQLQSKEAKRGRREPSRAPSNP